ncbi:hypothetical protein MKX03_028040 [Papaver bracteatum]|nr:hypothetical protein MKX03_028040 [Papaver bracteatum]
MDKPPDLTYGYKLHGEVKKMGHTVLMPKHVDSASMGCFTQPGTFFQQFVGISGMDGIRSFLRKDAICKL